MSSRFPESFGRYTLLEQVAVGGMAEILLALEDTPQAGRRFVTIKRIRPEYKDDPDFVDFFISEGRVSLQCSHPNLASSFELNQVNGVYYIAMEYIRGHTLLDVIRASYHEQRHISIATGLAIIGHVAAALEHLHEMRDVEGRPLHVIHRDVTPQNIMIDSAGTVKLIDLGIARSDVQVHKTKAGVVKGKFCYMAPEQLVSNDALDHRCDIFALGIVLHEVLTSRALFRGDTDEDTLDRVRRMPIPLLTAMRPDATQALDDLALRALERKPRHRFQSAHELLRAIEAIQRSGYSAGPTQLRDEVLSLCGDPPVPTLSGKSFGALRDALRASSEEGSAADDELGLEFFIQAAGLNTIEARARARILHESEADAGDEPDDSDES